ncbi:MAG: aminoglycoside phosphotransferase family protein [Syntrophales bacterium]|jgi:N-acetylmuramate 1-kinase
MTHLDNEMLQFVRQTLGLGSSDALTSMPLAKRGSGRSFHRIRYKDHGSVVFMCYDQARKENSYYAAIADFLLKIQVPVPRILAHDHLRGFVVMEDLGDRDLWSYRDESWTKRGAYYRATLSVAYRLHAFPVEDFPLDKVPLMEGFGPDLYRWERNYFLDNFVHAVCGIKINSSDAKDLEDELKSLSERLEDKKPSLVHRDLQSQNVMISKDQPAFIDFQGMRSGNLFYDLGSLLYDPYVLLTEDERMGLLLYYYQLPARGGADTSQNDISSGNKAFKVSHVKTDILQTDWAGFQDKFRDASAQRLMQALGAYGFLGLRSGLAQFLAYIPKGILNLVDSATRAKRLPLLKELALRCQQSFGRKILSTE